MSEQWWVPFVGIGVTVISGVLTVVLNRAVNFAVNKFKVQEAEKEAIQCILEGMAKAQEEIVRKAKAVSADGKLSPEEIKEAKDMAITQALNVANGPAKDLLISWSEERVESLIKQLLAKYAK